MVLKIPKVNCFLNCLSYFEVMVVAFLRLCVGSHIEAVDETGLGCCGRDLRLDQMTKNEQVAASLGPLSAY